MPKMALIAFIAVKAMTRSMLMAREQTILMGGEGTDTVRYRWSKAAVTVNLSDQSQNAGDAAGDEYISIENIRGTNYYSDTLIGDAGDNQLWGFWGDDTLTGGAGSDVFVFHDSGIDISDFGKNVITDFQSGHGSDDVIFFDAEILADFDAVIAAASDDGSDTVIMLDDDSSVTLNGVLVSDLHSDDFQFI